ncbi:MAG: sugar dehydrogenase [Nitriliruptor sp.]|nr:MAG: sugar dehydrogenase [Nitriliruptor sp.]
MLNFAARRPLPPSRLLLALAGALVLAACSAAGEPEAEQPPDTDPPEIIESDEPDDADPDDEPADEPADEPEPAPDPDLSVDVALVEAYTMDSPIAGAVGPDGTLYLAERAGTVHPVTADGVGDPVVDVSGTTTVDSERGLLGIAFSADGQEFYASYTDAAGDSVLAAHPVDGDGRIDGDTQRTVMTVDQPRANHNGGDVRVGPDGMVYWALGDGGGGGDPEEAGQDLTTRLGALLRIDPQATDPYGVPADNPFVDRDDARPEIWAYGLRNPWRFAFDHDAEDLWIADVGQNTREEINRVPADLAGANYGWNLMEGTLSFAGDEPDDHVPPVHEYDTTRSRCSITGGVVYRGARIPELAGAYLFSDYCEGDIRAIVVDDDGQVVDEANLAASGGSIVAFVEAADGEVYVLDLDGVVSRIVPAG